MDSGEKKKKSGLKKNNNKDKKIRFMQKRKNIKALCMDACKCHN